MVFPRFSLSSFCRHINVTSFARSVQMTEPQSVQGYIDQTPSWPDGTPTPTVPMTRMQWRIWLLRHRRQVLRGLVVFMTGVALPLIVQEFGLAGRRRASWAPPPGRHHGRRRHAGRVGRHLRAARACSLSRCWSSSSSWSAWPSAPSLRLAGLLPVRRRRGAGLRLSHRAPRDFREHPEPRPRATGAGRLRLPGGRRAGRHGAGLLRSWPSIPQLGAWRWMYAVVIVPACARRARPPVRHRQRPVADVAAAAAPSAERELQRLLEREPQYPKQVQLAEAIRPARPCAIAGGAAGATSFDKKNRRATILGLRAVVPAGSRHLRHRHLHADHPGPHGRPRDRPRPQRGGGHRRATSRRAKGAA